MKNPNGYGSVVKLSGNRRKPFAVRVTVGWTSEGTQIVKYLDFFKTRKEALTALGQYNNAPMNIDARRITFLDVYEMLTKRNENVWTSKNMDAYNNAFKYFDTLNSKTFAALVTEDFLTCFDECPKGYSTQTKMKSLLNQMYELAQEKKIVATNYSKFVATTDKYKPNGKAFTDDLIEDLISKRDLVEVQWLLVLLYTGMRVGEFLTIRMENVCLEDQIMIGGIKTQAGKNRRIPIADGLLPIVRDMTNGNKTWLLEPHVSYSAVRNKMIQFIQGYHVHHARHTCITLLDKAGVSESTIKEIVGHSQKTVTTKTYMHKSDQQLIDAVNLICEL